MYSSCKLHLCSMYMLSWYVSSASWIEFFISPGISFAFASWETSMVLATFYHKNLPHNFPKKRQLEKEPGTWNWEPKVANEEMWLLSSLVSWCIQVRGYMLYNYDWTCRTRLPKTKEIWWALTSGGPFRLRGKLQVLYILKNVSRSLPKFRRNFCTCNKVDSIQSPIPK